MDNAKLFEGAVFKGHRAMKFEISWNAVAHALIGLGSRGIKPPDTGPKYELSRAAQRTPPDVGWACRTATRREQIVRPEAPPLDAKRVGFDLTRGIQNPSFQRIMEPSIEDGQ
jgi:hypothetical protein